MQQSPGASADSSQAIRTRWGDSSAGWPIKPSIASVIVVAMLVMASAIIYMGWRSARASMLETAAASARDAGLIITERSNKGIDTVRVGMRLLASSALVEATSLDTRLKRLRLMTEMFGIGPLVSAVYVGYGDGAFMLVRPLNDAAALNRFSAPEGSRYMVQSRDLRTDGQTVGEFLFFDGALGLLEKRDMPDYVFDPRTRGWFQASSITARSYSSAPYVFFTTQQLGITVSQASFDRSAVFGVDVRLDDLAATFKALRMTPNTEIALIDNGTKVIVHSDMARALVKRGEKIEFQPVAAIGIPSLQQLNDLHTETGKVVNFKVDGEEWLGAALPFDAWQADGVRLMVAAPADDFLVELKSEGRKLMLWVAALVLLLTPMGWYAGSMIGKNLDRLTALARRMNRFDFDQGQAKPTLIKEVNTLSDVMSDMGKTIHTFLQISHDMATEPKVARMLDNVLLQVVTATRCLAGAVYLCDEDHEALRRAAYRGDFSAVSEPLDRAGVERTAALVQRDLAPGLGEMQVQLRGRNGQLEGLLVLQHKQDAEHADPAFADFVTKLSGMLAVSIETRQLFDAQKNLLDAVIRLLADAIDAKSPYTGGHCERVPELAGMIVDQMARETSGPYASFSMTEDQRYEFHLGAWLHDCGKVTSPEHIVDKSTKLEAIFNRIHEIRTRFEVIWRDLEIAHLQRVAVGQEEVASRATLSAARAQLQSDFAFVAQCNVGGEFMADEAVARLQGIGSRGWLAHFDQRLGLSGEEARRLAEVQPEPQPLPTQQHLLADRAEHVLPWGDRKPPVGKGDPENHHGFDMALPGAQQNLGELYNLSVRRGTLTDEDRFKINDHIVQTLVMLKSLPWPPHLARVPDIAATHHEKMDGNGYPRKLGADQLSVADRVMALADIFEALTAADRPYKAAKTLAESLKIMAFMCKDQHIDTGLFRYFLHSRIWQTYAVRYLKPEQIDTVDLAAMEKLLPAARAESRVTAEL